ncbi:MAG: hypothetical protein Q8930_18280, partial [Bacillota bacterium]|nr:hypothetical protein [Bacillota bacterium]
WKINVPKIILMGAPALIFFLYYFISIWSSQFVQNVKAYSLHVFANYPPTQYYAPLLHLIFGYSIITALYKSNDEIYVRSRINSAVTSVENLIRKLIGSIKRYPWRAGIVIACTILCVAIFVNSIFYRKIEDIAGINFDIITSIELSYRGTIKNPEEVKEFTDMLRKSILRKTVYKYDTNGYFLTEPPLVTFFYSNDRILFRIYFKGNYVSITNSQTDYSSEYEIKKDSISIEKLERLVDSWN